MSKTHYGVYPIPSGMRILAIETSCDETAVCVLEAEGGLENATFSILGNSLYSQVAVHAPYGGVFPTLAKREHQNNLVPLTLESLKQAGMMENGKSKTEEKLLAKIREEEFRNNVKDFLESFAKPAIDMIAVTTGPGLEPALWTGITFAEALGASWDIPVRGIDHMEGHIVSALLKPQMNADKAQIDAGKNQHPATYNLQATTFPVLALLISGGHTELVLMKEWFSYERIGETRDDAIGEAFDKVARLLDLAYPGGPKIGELAAKARARLAEAVGSENPITFPRPMKDDLTCDFSFSGLKTAVLYKLKSMDKLSEEDKEHIAEAFESAARDVIVMKTKRALKETGAQTLVVGGGVSANEEIRKSLAEMAVRDFPTLAVHFPDQELTGDNAIMIGAAGFLRSCSGHAREERLTATGTLKLG